MEPLAKLFGSPTRLRLLRLFCFNEASFTAEDASSRTKCSKESVRKELAVLVSAGFLEKRAARKSRGAAFAANRNVSYFNHLRDFLLATTTINHARIASLMKKAGAVKLLLLSGVFTDAIESAVDIFIVGEKLDERVIAAAVRMIEADLGKELRYACFETATFRYRLGVYDRLIRDVLDYRHELLVNKLGIDR